MRKKTSGNTRKAAKKVTFGEFKGEESNQKRAEKSVMYGKFGKGHFGLMRQNVSLRRRKKKRMNHKRKDKE